MGLSEGVCVWVVGGGGGRGDKGVEAADFCFGTQQ